MITAVRACAAGTAFALRALRRRRDRPGMLIGTTRVAGRRLGRAASSLTRASSCACPAGLSDEAAVLIEPLACSVHAVRAARCAGEQRARDRRRIDRPPDRGGAARARREPRDHGGWRGTPSRPSTRERLGASHGGDAAPTPRALAEIAGRGCSRPIIGASRRRWAASTPRSSACGGTRGVDDALRFTRAGGTVMLLGNVAGSTALDWTPLWPQGAHAARHPVLRRRRRRHPRRRPARLDGGARRWIASGRADLGAARHPRLSARAASARRSASRSTSVTPAA